MCVRVSMLAETTNSSMGKARSILETARLKIPQNPVLWLAAIRVEEACGSNKVAEVLLAKALQECPSSGALWAHAIASDARPLRKVEPHTLDRSISFPTRTRTHQAH